MKCGIKHPHKSQGAAEAHIRALVARGQHDGGQLRPYQCRLCRLWHIGHVQRTVACRSCSVPILFIVTTTTGRPMPLDPDPRSDGNVVIEADGRARTLKLGEEHPGPRYMSHFVTCVDAARWRKRA